LNVHKKIIFIVSEMISEREWNDFRIAS